MRKNFLNKKTRVQIHIMIFRYDFARMLLRRLKWIFKNWGSTNSEF